MATIVDVAQAAGVSVATVSRVLNGKGRVGSELRERVMRAAQALQYVPNTAARNLRRSESGTVLILAPNLTNPYYTHILAGIGEVAQSCGYRSFLCNTGGGREATLRYLRAVTEKQVDGIVLVGSVFNSIGRDPEVESYLRLVPVVLANGKLDIPNAASVLLDDAGGAALATQHLVAMGRRNLWYVKDLDTASANAKRDGFLKATETLGVRGRVIETEFSIEGGKQAAKELMSSCRLFDGIVCGEDETAVGVVKGLAAAGMRIPRDVAVTGYNNSIYTLMCEPRLTSIDNKPELVGRTCVRLLEHMMDGDEDVEPVIIKPEIVQGMTT